MAAAAVFSSGDDFGNEKCQTLGCYKASILLSIDGYSPGTYLLTFFPIIFFGIVYS